MKRISLISVVTLLTIFIACNKEDVPVGAYNFGSLNTTKYVSIGNSITAGLQSNALFEAAQKYSYPSLIAQQLGISSFTQPLMKLGTGTLIILDSISLTPFGAVPKFSYKPLDNPPENYSHAMPFDNLGIPGAILADAIDTSSIVTRATDRLNPFYTYIMRDQVKYGSSLVAQAIKLNPTILTFWLGNNDVLGYAVSGGTKGTNQSAPKGTLPTEVTAFETYLTLALGAIKTALPNTKVVVANIPDVTSIPIFNTVPKKIPNPSDPTKLLDIYYRKNDGSTAVVGADDFVLLQAQSVLGGATFYGLTPANPLDTKYVLDADEAAKATTAVRDFNAIIKRLVEQFGYTLVDINGFFTDIKNNKFIVAGETFNVGFLSGGIFSLDGVHPTAKGQAIIANKFLEAMNKAYNANIPYVDVTMIPGVKAPGQAVLKANTPLSPTFRFPANMFDDLLKYL